ncbi:hypothetical protein D5R40_34920 [Okeania hirsuta]|uniref:Uncharacterized protein n=1 Tax=Okeania hirsuta TaxID=1458930 RepID=A0A3N6N7H1_9CYAN|nr:hypothetical protein D5R40_34920 [Okeania hirsuta]
MRFYPKDRIVPTEKDTFFRLTQLHGTVHDEGAAMMGGVSANAGLFGSANDLAKLFQMYLKEGSYGESSALRVRRFQEFTKCQYCEEGNRRGLGLDKPLIEYDKSSSSVAEQASPSSFGHSRAIRAPSSGRIRRQTSCTSSSPTASSQPETILKSIDSISGQESIRRFTSHWIERKKMSPWPISSRRS